MVIVGLAIVLSLVFLVNSQFLREKFGVDLSGEFSDGVERLNNRQERLVYWRFYVTEIFDSYKSFWLGHVSALIGVSFKRTQLLSGFYLQFWIFSNSSSFGIGCLYCVFCST